MAALKSPASSVISAADPAVCCDPAANACAMSATCDIACTTWSDADRCCWVATEISATAVVVESTICAIRSSAVEAAPATSTPRPASRAPASDASTVVLVYAWISVTRPWICAVDSWARSASLRTSAATTAKPRPCSPARAASMAAFSARRFVCSLSSSISTRIRPISLTFSPRADELRRDRVDGVGDPADRRHRVLHGRKTLARQRQRLVRRVGHERTRCRRSAPRSPPAPRPSPWSR